MKKNLLLVACLGLAFNTFAQDWQLLGNSGTSSSTNFVGTTDAQDLVFKANSAEGFRLKTGGNVGIGNTNPAYKLDVAGDINLSSGQGLRINGDKLFTSIGTGCLNIGINAGPVNTGNFNVFLGVNAGLVNSTGYSNTFLGTSAGSHNTTGVYNTFLGRDAGTNNSSGNYNTFTGLTAGFANTTGEGNTFDGYMAGYSVYSGSHNVCLGNFSGASIYAGNQNVEIGKDAGLYAYDGSENVIIGGSAGMYSRGSYHTILGAGATTSNTNINYSTALGYQAYVTTSNTMVLGRGTTDVVINRNSTSASGYRLEVNGNSYGTAWLTPSDKRFKKNITDYTNAISVIRKLHPVKYEYRDDVYIKKEEGDTKEAVKMEFSKGDQVGFIAQELEVVLPSAVMTRGDGYKAVNYNQLFGVVVQGMKEQDVILTKHEEQIKNLSDENAELKELVQSLNARLSALENGGKATTPAPAKTDLTPRLEQNSPNPFSENTVVKYFIPEQTAGPVKIVIRSDKAKEVISFSIDHKGYGNVVVSGNSLTAGSYSCELQVNGKTADIKKMILVK